MPKNDVYQKAEFREKLGKFLHAGHVLLMCWEDLPDQRVVNYPEHMPSFEEFLHELQDLDLKD